MLQHRTKGAAFPKYEATAMIRASTFHGNLQAGFHTQCSGQSRPLLKNRYQWQEHSKPPGSWQVPKRRVLFKRNERLAGLRYRFLLRCHLELVTALCVGSTTTHSFLNLHPSAFLSCLVFPSSTAASGLEAAQGHIS